MKDARIEVNTQCSNLGIPADLIVQNSEKLEFKGKKYVYEIRYINSIRYSKQLSGCIDAFVCSQKWSDYKIECNKQRSFMREFFLGYSKCNLTEPDC